MCVCVCVCVYLYTMYKIDNLMRTYSIAQGTLLNALWWPKWEELQKRGEIYIYIHTHIHIADSLWCIAKINTTL